MRTDRTQLCGYCALRFAPAPRCPKCGTTRVYDLTRSRDRRNGMRLLRRHYRSRPERWLASGGAAACLVVSPVAGLLTGLACSSGGLGAAVFAIGFAGSAAATIYLDKLLKRRRAASRALHISVWPPPAPTEGAATETFTGRVKLVEPVRAALSEEPCAAYRLVGSGPVGPIDEAGGGIFELALEGRDGRHVRVDATVATIDLPLRAAPTVVEPRRFRSSRSPLARLARERALCPQLGAMRLAEARLDEGEWARVSGTVSHQPAPRGYRTGRQRVLREQAGSPLLVGLRAAGAAPEPAAEPLSRSADSTAPAARRR